MATATVSDFKIYNDQFKAGYAEKAAQLTNLFNAQSNNAIRLINRPIRGDYEYQALFTEIASLVSRRDATSVSAATAVKPAQNESISVKLKRKLGPIELTLDSLRSVNITPETFSMYLGEMLAKAQAVEMVSISLRAMVAAIVNVGATVLYDVSATDKLTSYGLIDAKALFGDNADNIRCWVFHSKPFYDLMKNQIAEGLDTVSGAILRSGKGGLATGGLPYVITDEAQLKAASLYYSLGLAEDAIKCEITEEMTPPFSEVVSGLENLVLRIQGEYAFNLSLKGFKWDVANGGANPAAAAVGTGSNWDQFASDIKNTAGVAIKTQ